VRLLLDTHIALGVIEEQTGVFSARTRGLLNNPESEFFVSVASLWEIAIKYRLGKLRLGVELQALPEELADLQIRVFPINEQHALAEVSPEPVTRDPFDRLLLAQCLVEGLRLVTVDRALVVHPLAAV